MDTDRLRHSLSSQISYLLFLQNLFSVLLEKTVDLLEIVRKLKSKGIEVIFEKENRRSLSGDGE